MLYRVVIIDNGNQVILTEKDGERSLEGNPDDEARFIMEDAIEVLQEVQDIG